MAVVLVSFAIGAWVGHTLTLHWDEIRELFETPTKEPAPDSDEIPQPGGKASDS